MESNTNVPQSIPPLPKTSSVKSNTGRNLLVLISAVLILVVLIATVYTLFSGSNKKTYTAKVYEPTPSIQVTATPTPPSGYQVNVKDASDQAINNDTQATDQNLNNLNTDINNIDQSFSDQQTNLQ